MTHKKLIAPIELNILAKSKQPFTHSLGSTMDFSSVPSIVMRPTFEDNYILNGAPWDPATQPAQEVRDGILRKM